MSINVLQGDLYKLPRDIITFEILSFLSDSDHIKYTRTNSINNKLYVIKWYKQRYVLDDVPSHIRESNKLTNLILIHQKYIDKLPLYLTSLYYKLYI